MNSTTTVEQIAELMPDATHLLSDEPEMESTLHWLQLVLLTTCLEWLWRDRKDFFIGSNLTIYFNRQQLKTRDFRGPDLFLVKGVENNEPRTSWVVWEEGGKYPDLIIELLSESTAEIDRKIKFDIYAEKFRTPEYFWFSPDTMEFAGFQLQGGSYAEIPVNENGWRWSNELNLFLGVLNRQLRYFTAEGELVLSMEEETIQALQEKRTAYQIAKESIQEADEAKLLAEREAVRANQEETRANLLAAKLRELGIDPDKI